MDDGAEGHLLGGDEGEALARSKRIWRPKTLSASIFSPVERSTARVGFRVPWPGRRGEGRGIASSKGHHTVSMEKTITIDDARVIRPWSGRVQGNCGKAPVSGLGRLAEALARSLAASSLTGFMEIMIMRSSYCFLMTLLPSV